MKKPLFAKTTLAKQCRRRRDTRGRLISFKKVLMVESDVGLRERSSAYDSPDVGLCGTIK